MSVTLEEAVSSNQETEEEFCSNRNDMDEPPKDQEDELESLADVVDVDA